jgi:hypothetical protein
MNGKEDWSSFLGWIVLVATLVAVVFLGISASIRLFDSSGDASIYWVFAKSTWSHGLFHYGPGGAAHGATSPLWMLILSAIYPFAGDNFIAYKIVGLVTVLLVGVSVFRLCRTIGFAKETASIAGCLMTSFVPLHIYSVQGYETALFAIVILEALRATIYLRDVENLTRSRLAAWVIGAGALPLARPEGGLFLVAYCIALIVIHRSRLRDARGLILALGLVILPVVLVYGGLALVTGEIVPSSI